MSPTVWKPSRSMSARVMTVTGAGPSISARLMREPTTETRSRLVALEPDWATAGAASLFWCSCSCATARPAGSISEVSRAAVRRLRLGGKRLFMRGGSPEVDRWQCRGDGRTVHLNEARTWPVLDLNTLLITFASVVTINY